MAYLLATNPETFEIMASNNINLFHGTNANALPSILNYGMKSVDEQAGMGITTTTGEQWSRIQGKRSFVSFTDNIDTAIEYSALKPSSSNQKEMSFGVLIGISSEDIKQMKTCRVHSDTPEIGIQEVPLEYIKFIAVPKSKVKFVSKLVNLDRTIVVPIELDERFYYIDDYEIYFDEQKANEITERRKRTGQSFGSEQVKKLAQGRKKSEIVDLYKKIKTMFNSKGKNNENDTRDK